MICPVAAVPVGGQPNHLAHVGVGVMRLLFIPVPDTRSSYLAIAVRVYETVPRIPRILRPEV